MSKQSWSETLITAQTDGAALASSTTPTSLLPPAAKFTLPANFFEIGKKLRIAARGRISTLVTSPGTLALDVRFGAVIVAAGGAMALNVVAKVNVPWELEMHLTCRAIGQSTSANLMWQAKFWSEAVVGAPLPTVGGSGMLLLPASAPAVGTGFDSTAAQAVDFFGTWSVNNAANSVQLHQYCLESLN